MRKDSLVELEIIELLSLGLEKKKKLQNMSKILFSKHQKPSEGRAQLQSGFMWAFVILQGITGGICIFVSGPSLKNYRV